MASPNEAFTIDLDSLTTFTQELTTQLSGMAQPKGHLDALTAGAILLGAFGEAHSLRTNHDVAVDEMSVLVGQARDAIDFATEITRSVTRSYEHYDDEVAAAMTAIGHTVEAVSGGAVPDVVPGLVPGQGNGPGNGPGNGLGNGLGTGVGNGLGLGLGLGNGLDSHLGGNLDNLSPDAVDAIVEDIIGDGEDVSTDDTSVDAAPDGKA